MIKNITVNTVVNRTVGQTSITSKASGSGGNDIENNLIELCGACHRKVHDGIISKEDLLKIVSRRKRR